MATPLTGWKQSETSSFLTLSDDDYVATSNGPFSSSVHYVTSASEAMNQSIGSGRFYWEVLFGGPTVNNTSAFFIAGISRDLSVFEVSTSLTLFELHTIVRSDGRSFSGNVLDGVTYNSGDFLGFSLDLNLGTIEFDLNGVSTGIIFSNIDTSGDWFPIAGTNSAAGSFNLRDGTKESVAAAAGLNGSSVDPNTGAVIGNPIDFVEFLGSIQDTYTSYYFLSVGIIDGNNICRADHLLLQGPSELVNPAPPFDVTTLEGFEIVIWNENDADPNIVIADLNLSASGTESKSVRATSGRDTRKWYWEYKIDSGDDLSLGLGNESAPLNSFVGADVNSWAISSEGSGDVRTNGTIFPTGVDFTVDDVIGIAFDASLNRLWFSVNGTFISGGDPASNLNPVFTDVSGTLFPMVSRANNGSWKITARFDESRFTFAIPAGFDAYDLTDGPSVVENVEVTWDEATIVSQGSLICGVTWDPLDKSSDVELSDGDLTAITGADGDLSFNNVEVLLHMDGISGGTVFTDDSSNGFTFTRFGSTLPTTETDIVQFGTAAGKFTSSSGERISTTDAVLNLDNGTDFTIEGWAYQETPAGGGAGVFGTGLAAAGGGTWIRVDSNGQVTFFIGSGSFGVDRVDTAAGAISANEWHHYAGTYIASSGTLELFIDGVS